MAQAAGWSAGAALRWDFLLAAGIWGQALCLRLPKSKVEEGEGGRKHWK